MFENAYAKVNLYLHVVGRRPNGYHELDSLVVFAQTGDRIFVEPNDDIALTITGDRASSLKLDEDNLVLRAARLLQTYSKTSKGAALTLEKNLPMAAGIGGGSSDAAATLRILCKFWDLQIEEKTLLNLALEMGADVPVCLQGSATIMRGIGEKLSPLSNLPDAFMVLVNPSIALSTPDVFKARPFSMVKETSFDPAEGFQGFVKALKQFENHLTKGACQLAPEIKNVLSEITDLPNCELARMSGSGSTCFGLFETKEAANNAAKTLSKQHPHWWVESAKMIS